MNPEPKNPSHTTRRDFLRGGLRATAFLGLGGLMGGAAWQMSGGGAVWQIDPQKCLRCGQCATACVLEQSAVRCVHAFELCGYCELCTGYFEPQPNELNTAAENQLCPTGAVIRKKVEDPYYEYVIDEELCIGCAKCVEGCNRFGNGSLYLQIRHDRCVNCNVCAIARACPADAFQRVPVRKPYLTKTIAH